MSSDLLSRIPLPEPSGFIPTLNRMGYMTSTLDPVSCSFIGFSSVASGPVLDIGAAYGIASRQALRTGAKVAVNDLDSRHLDLLRDSISLKSEQSRLSLHPGDFLSIDWEKDHYGAVLVARVLHFLDGPAFEAAARKLYDLLAPGGRCYIVCETAWLRNFQSFIPEFEQRISQGDLWPGLIHDVMRVAPDRGASLPKLLNFVTPQVLRRVFEAAGFKTLLCTTMARTDFPADLQWDGRESAGYVGEK